MKFKVWEKRENPENLLLFRVTQDGDDIDLRAVEEDGSFIEGGRILCLDSEGRLHIYSDRNRNLGLKLDREGRVEMVED